MNNIDIRNLQTDIMLRENTIPELIETHISWVILTEVYAYKIKKPIKYSFLDYDDLTRRKYYCEQEVQLNRRLTDGIYLGVIPVFGKKSVQSFHHIHNSEIVDYAVKMKRINASRQMNLMLEENRISPRIIRSLAEMVAHFHQKANIVFPKFQPEAQIQLYNDISTVKDYLHNTLGRPVSNIIDRSIQFAETFVFEHEYLFKERIEYGFIRDVHGDLYSKNIFICEEPIIFDCIDFNHSFRQIDVLNEIAFFCMDLDAYDKKDLSSMFLNDYLKLFPVIGKHEDELLFNYYKSYRANVRAKVNALRASQSVDHETVGKWVSEADRYVRLMNTYVE